MIEGGRIYLRKAQQSLAGAQSELANGRYDNCANRCYYACFQAAVHALTEAGIQPRGVSGQWSHTYVPAQFDGMLIHRRKLYPTELRNTLGRTYLLRQKADYEEDVVSHVEAYRALRRAEAFVQAIESSGGEDR